MHLENRIFSESLNPQNRSSTVISQKINGAAARRFESRSLKRKAFRFERVFGLKIPQPLVRKGKSFGAIQKIPFRRDDWRETDSICRD